MYFKELQVAEGRGRRRHLAEFKAKLVEECRQPGVSVARVARDNGVNANLLHQWIVSSRARNVGVAEVPQVGESFVPVQISPSGAVATTVAPIVVEIQRGSPTVTVNWPIEAAAECLQVSYLAESARRLPVRPRSEPARLDGGSDLAGCCPTEIRRR